MKKNIIIFLLLIVCFTSGYKKPHKYTIDAEKDAFLHNNVALNYLNDRCYYAAIQEFKIAIQLSPNTQSTAVFKNNLGETYDKIGYPEMARVCFEDAIELYSLNFKYYLNLIECYAKLNILETKIKELQNSEKTYDRIKLGLLYIKNDEKRKGIIILDEFCAKEADLLITPTIQQYIKDVATTL